jgi:hypothetical protein
MHEVRAPYRAVRFVPPALLARGLAHSSVHISIRTHEHEERVMSIIVEIRAAEGGDDAKSLVTEQFAIYARRALRHGL